MKKQNKSMISMMHRLVEFCGKYKIPIRISYLPGFIKGLVMKSPLMASFFLACDFMAGRMTKKSCLIYGLIILACVILQALMQNITDRLQSATGFKVFADKRMEMGDRFRKLTMGYFTEGNIGKVSRVLATDMNFIEENCMMVLEELVGIMISQGLMIAFMFFLNWRLGLTALVCLLLVILFGNITTRISISHSMLKQKTAEKMTSAVLEFAEGIGIIKTFNLLGEKSKEVSESFEESSKNSIGFEMAYAPWWASVLISYGIVTALTLFVSALLSSKGMMTNEYFLGMVLFAFDLFAFDGYKLEKHGDDVRGLPLKPIQPPINCVWYNKLQEDNKLLLKEFLQWVKCRNLEKYLQKEIK